MTRAERIEKIKSVVQNPDFILVEEVLREKIEKLLYIEDIDDKQTGTDIKAQIKANKRTVKELNNFLTEMGLLKKAVEPRRQNLDYK